MYDVRQGNFSGRSTKKSERIQIMITLSIFILFIIQVDINMACHSRLLVIM